MASIFRSTLQTLAEMRIREARILLKAKEFAGSYHLAGFAVECGLKACIAKKCKRYEFPQKELTQQVFSHSPAVLIRLAGLEMQMNADTAARANLKRHWGNVSKWNPECRYSPAMKRTVADDFCKAVDDPVDGILTWIRAHW